jgi:hypothetical protein
MTSPKTTWRQALVDAHPDLFRVEDRGYSFAAGYPAVGDGWRDLLETAVARIVAADVGRCVKIDQIKSKYGTLRIYWASTTAIDDAVGAGIEEAVALAEARSECTCETCGREARLYSAGGWLSTACEAHASGKPTPVLPGHEGVHVVRTFDGERERIVSCRRYVREADAFVDVDPATLDLADE